MIVICYMNLGQDLVHDTFCDLHTHSREATDIFPAVVKLHCCFLRSITDSDVVSLGMGCVTTH